VNRNVSPPVVLLALVVLAALLFGIYRMTVPATQPANPGLADIPPRQPGDDRPAAPPKDAGPAPGTMPR